MIKMNISNISDETFSAKEWINSLLRKDAPTSKNQIILQNLVSECELYAEKVNAVIGENCEKLANNLPKIIMETEQLNNAVELFSDKLLTIKREIEAVEENCDDSVTKLKKLDRLKTTLENVKQALHEADNWSILASDIEECFDHGNIEKVASTLVSLQQSLSILSNVDDYEEKKMQLEGLKNRLEATVSPHVVKAFTTYNLEESLKYVNMFKDIERLPQLVKYYIKCQKGYLCQYWKSLIDSEQDMNLAEQLRSLYDTLLFNWQKQIRWCEEVFPSVNMINMMIELYAETLLDLDPSIASCMDLSLKQQAQPLLLLLEYHQISSQFQKNLESLYVFNNDSNAAPDWKPLLKSIYNPYIPYASKYGTLERQLLDTYLWDCFSKVESETDLVDYIRNVELTIPVIMNIAKEAESRCMQFTHGCALNGLIFALKGYFLRYIEKYKSISEQLSQKVDDKEYWSSLTSCLSFQQVVGEFLNEIKNYEIHLKQQVTLRRTKDSKIYASFILNESALEDFENLLAFVSNDVNPTLTLLSNVTSALEKLAYEMHQITYKVSFQPILFHLSSTKEMWSKLNAEVRDLPDYSYSPMEYITQIGEHLMTLPQHLEPFLSQEKVALNSVLEIIGKETENISTDKGTYANVLLMLVAYGTCQVYSDQILNIRELNSSSIRQLAADLDYLGNVLEELGIGLSDDLQKILKLLRLSPEEYQSKSVGFPPKLVAAIRQIRKLPST